MVPFDAHFKILRLYMGVMSSLTESLWAVTEDGGAGQPLWEILFWALVHDVAQRSFRAWESWVYTEWSNDCFLWSCELSEILIYNCFFITLKVYYSYDIARQEWEAFLPSADLWYREIHAHSLHPNSWPGLSALWFGFQETTVSWRDYVCIFLNFMWMFLLYRHHLYVGGPKHLKLNPSSKSEPASSFMCVHLMMSWGVENSSDFFL